MCVGTPTFNHHSCILYAWNDMCCMGKVSFLRFFRTEESENLWVGSFLEQSDTKNGKCDGG